MPDACMCWVQCYTLGVQRRLPPQELKSVLRVCRRLGPWSDKQNRVLRELRARFPPMRKEVKLQAGLWRPVHRTWGLLSASPFWSKRVSSVSSSACPPAQQLGGLGQRCFLQLCFSFHDLHSSWPVTHENGYPEGASGWLAQLPAEATSGASVSGSEGLGSCRAFRGV